MIRWLEKGSKCQEIWVKFLVLSLMARSGTSSQILILQEFLIFFNFTDFNLT